VVKIYTPFNKVSARKYIPCKQPRKQSSCTLRTEHYQSYRFEFLNLSIRFEIAKVNEESFDAVESFWLEEVEKTEEFLHIVL